MKYILFLLPVMLQTFGNAQHVQEPFMTITHPIETAYSQILLSRDFDESNIGFWDKGDYKICIEKKAFETFLLNDYASLVHLIEELDKNDSATLVRYNLYADRYLIAINQLKAAESGFDLSRLVVYIGPDNVEQNKGNSSVVETFMRNSVENGHAAVFFKGQRIYILKRQIERDHMMSVIKMYYDGQDNCAYHFIGHLNW